MRVLALLGMVGAAAAQREPNGKGAVAEPSLHSKHVWLRAHLDAAAALTPLLTRVTPGRGYALAPVTLATGYDDPGYPPFFGRLGLPKHGLTASETSTRPTTAARTMTTRIPVDIPHA